MYGTVLLSDSSVTTVREKRKRSAKKCLIYTLRDAVLCAFLDVQLTDRIIQAIEKRPLVHTNSETGVRIIGKRHRCEMRSYASRNI